MSREKNLAKQQAKLKSQSKGGDPEKRNANDKAALQAKVAKKAEMKKQQEAEAARAEANKPVVRKKTGKKKEADNLDDLLSAGLAKGKKK